MRKLTLALLAILALSPAVHAAVGAGCQATSGTSFPLEKIRTNASGTEIFGCINRSFEALASSVPVNSTSAVALASWLHVNRISGHATGAVGVQMSSYTWFTSSVTIAGGGGLAITYGINASTAVFASLSAPTITSSATIKGGGGLLVTYGVAAATAAFTGSVSAGQLALTYGVSAATGSFSGSVTVGSMTSLGAGESVGLFAVLGSASPYYRLTSTTWGTGAPFFIQANVDPTAAAVGDYVGFLAPSGKGFSFASGTTSRAVIDPASGNFIWSPGTLYASTYTYASGNLDLAGRLNSVNASCANSTCIGGGTGFNGVGSIATSADGVALGDMAGNAKGLKASGIYIHSGSYTTPVASQILMPEATAKIGIGTATPDDMLDVEGGDIRISTRTGGGLHIVDAQEGNNWYFTGHAGGAGIGYTREGTRHINLSESNTYVGFGTVAPGAPIHISGGGTANALRMSYSSTLNDTAYVGVTSAADLQVYAYNGSAYRNILLGMDGATPGGKVGIGTGSPTATIHVSSGSGVNGTGVMKFATISLADDATIATETNFGTGGVLTVQALGNTSNATCIFRIKADSNSAAIISDPDTLCAVTDTDTKISIIVDGDSTYTLKNRLGGTENFAIQFVGR